MLSPEGVGRAAAVRWFFSEKARGDRAGWTDRAQVGSDRYAPEEWNEAGCRSREAEAVGETAASNVFSFYTRNGQATTSVSSRRNAGLSALHRNAFSLKFLPTNLAPAHRDLAE